MHRRNYVVNISGWLIVISFGFSYFTGIIGIVISTILALFVLFFDNGCKGLTKKRALIFVCAILLLLWHNREMNFGGFVAFILKLFCIYSVLQLKSEILNEVRKKFLNIFTIISGVSLFFWCLYLMGINIFPTSKITMEGLYELENHVVFVTTDGQIELYRRFQSVFLEPGIYGLLCVICLVLNKFQKDIRSLVLLLSCIFSLSLAAYLILLFLVLYRFYVIKRKTLVNLLMPLFIILGVYYVGMNYNGGDNVLYNAIFWRLTLDDENNLAGYDRRTDHFDDYFETMIRGKKIMVGIGPTEYAKRQFDDSVDLKGFIALDGIVGLSLFMIFYLITLKCSVINRETVMAVIVFLLIFYRGFVMSLTLGGILLYVMAIVTIGYETSLKNNESVICPSK